MLSLVFQLPLKNSKLFPTFIDLKGNNVHVDMDGQLEDFLFLGSKIKRVGVVGFGEECYCAILESALDQSYLILRTSLVISNRLPRALKFLMRSLRPFSYPNKFFKKFIWILLIIIG